MSAPALPSARPEVTHRTAALAPLPSFPVIPKNFPVLANFSLFSCLGNCERNGCGTAVSRRIGLSWGPKFAKFPVKFPVSREFGGRPARSALHRQPGSPRFRASPPRTPEEAANSGLSRTCTWSPPSHLAVLASQIAKSLRPFSKIFPFSGDCGRRLSSKATVGGGRQLCREARLFRVKVRQLRAASNVYLYLYDATNTTKERRRSSGRPPESLMASSVAILLNAHHQIIEGDRSRD